MQVEEKEIYDPSGEATLYNEPESAPNGASISAIHYYTSLWREWYNALSNVDRFDYMFQELPLQFRTTENLLCINALNVFDNEWAKKRWNIIDPPTLEEKIEFSKTVHKETFPEAYEEKPKVSKKDVDNSNKGDTVSAAQAFAEINSLVDELVYHEKKYYEDHAPEISDYEFDMKMKRLEELEEKFPEFKHSESPTARVGSEGLNTLDN